ncbi:unnamed protein product [Amaranthus hypochondriacus]
MALSCRTVVPLGCNNHFLMHNHKHEIKLNKSLLNSKFQGNRAHAIKIKRGLTLCCKDSNGATLETLTKPSVDESESSVDGNTNTMSVILGPGLEPATINIPDHVKRSDFPSDFIFGASSSALQTEGNGKEGGRAPSTWDSKLTLPGGNGMGIDSYSLFKDDVKLLKEMGMTAYRFSISWSRILPYAGLDNTITNPHGIEFYNKFIDELIANGITPFVTLFHFDLPQTVQDKYCGFLDKKIIVDFKDYADVCFKNFGDRVKHWITINEPYNFSLCGFKMGPSKINNNKVDPNPFVATHNIIITHAAAVKHYRDNYQEKQGGKIGISLSSLWFEPFDQRNGIHVRAQKNSLDMMLGWYMNPLVFGEYPKIMEEVVIGGLPKFTPEERMMVQGSYDFIGINYYTSRYVAPTQVCGVDTVKGIHRTEYIEQTVKNKNCDLIGPPAPESTDIYVVPTGLGNLLLHVKHTYNNPEVYVTENGVPSTPIIGDSIRNLAEKQNVKELENALLDGYRINYIAKHLFNLREALADVTFEDKEAVTTNVKGYFVWALADNMEVGKGYSTRYGLNYVDYHDRHRRYRKASSFWFSHFLKSPDQQTTEKPKNKAK